MKSEHKAAHTAAPARPPCQPRQLAPKTELITWGHFGDNRGRRPSNTSPISGPAFFNNADAYKTGVLSRTAPSGIPQGNPSPFGSVGSATQEAGWQPAVTKVPIRPMPTTPLTPQSVPGPDTSGKGNLLTSLAKTGDERAAIELLRRGRRVLFVPDSDSPKYISSDDFADLIDRLQQQ